MKDPVDDTLLAEEPSKVILKELEIRTLLAQERLRATQLLDREHYLGAASQVGNTLIQVVHHHGRWVALLEWGPAALKLTDREEWIGWTDIQRAQRLGLIVQNRRFLVLSETRMPNLASRALSLAAKALPEAWRQKHNYAPVLAETFTDIEQFEGTCYKVSGWLPCGLTKGFGRQRPDFYRAHDRPKKLWLKTLNRNARSILCALDLPGAYAPGANPGTSERALPIKTSQIESLQSALRAVPDPRASNRVFSCSSLLTLTAMALLAGRRHVAEIHRFGQFLTDRQRATLGWPRKKGLQRRRAPSYSALYNLLTKLDPHALAATLTHWLQTHQGTLPRALAVDGKYVRDQVLTLCLSEHETGAPVAIAVAAPAPRTEKTKQEGELSAARRLYEQCDLNNALITGDALHCDRKTLAQLPAEGGDFLLQLKENQPKAFQQAQKIFRSQPPLFQANAATSATDGSINAG